MNQAQLAWLWDVNADIRASLKPPEQVPPQKLFCPKYPIPVLLDYTRDIYPLKYWGTWEKFPITDGKAEPWINTVEFKRQLLEAGINPDSETNRVILNDLEHGANIGATGRARLPTEGKNSALAFEYGSRLQEALQELLFQNAMKGPLDRDEIPYADIKVHTMAAKLKPTGKVRSIVDCSGPYTEDVGAPGFIYNPEYPGSLNSTIQKSEFPVNLTSLAEFVDLLWDNGLGAEMTKLDQEAAYRHVPVRPEDLHLQFVKWGDKYFQETKLMFGGTSSPGIYDRFAGLFLFLCVRKTRGMRAKDAARYLDDVMAVGPKGSTILRDFYDQYRQTAAQIGLRLDKSGNRAKCQPPETTIIALGVHFDTEAWTWRMDAEKGARLLHEIESILEGNTATIKQRERIVGKILDMSQLLTNSKHRLGPIFDFGDGSNSHVVEATLVWWSTKIKRAVEGYPIPKPGPHMSGDLINAWTDAAGPSQNHIRGVGVAIPGYGWTFLSWPTWMEFMNSPVWDSKTNDYLEVHTNRMSMLEELGVLAALCMLNEHACNKTLQVFVDNSGAVFAYAKGYSRKCRLLNTIISAIKIVSQSLGINVVVTDIMRRSDEGSRVTDDLSKANKSTLPRFMGSSNRVLLIPQTIWDWMNHATMDDYTLGHRIIAEINSCGGTRAVAPYAPKFVG